MVKYQRYFVDKIQNLKSEGRYRVFNVLDHSGLRFPIAYHASAGRDVVIWCSNNYLGMAQNPVVIESSISALKESGSGSGGTRNISGTYSNLVDLEHKLAKMHHKDAALVFTSGYVANQAALSSICSTLTDCVVFSDALNHASMIQGIKDSKVRYRIFKHNDVNHLEELLREYPVNLPKIIVFESVYSMDGCIAPILELCNIAEKYHAMTYVDEVHALGMYGAHGAGICEMLGVQEKIDIIQGNFAKGYGVIGGYIAGDAFVVDVVRSTASGYIFTTSLPPSIVAAAKASVTYLQNSNKEREKHMLAVQRTKQALRSLHVEFVDSPSHIIPIIIGDPRICQQVSLDLLHEFGIYVQTINYPTVPRGTERLRVTPTPLHTLEMIEEFALACSTVLKKNQISLIA